MKKRTSLVLEEILGSDEDKEIKKIDDYLFSLGKPKNFSGRKGVEIRYVKSFEQMCIIMSQHINMNPKKMTVIEYYQAWVILKKQCKKK